MTKYTLPEWDFTVRNGVNSAVLGGGSFRARTAERALQRAQAWARQQWPERRRDLIVTVAEAAPGAPRP